MPPDKKSWILLVCVVVSGIKIDPRRCSELLAYVRTKREARWDNAAPSMKILAKRTCPLMRSKFRMSPSKEMTATVMCRRVMPAGMAGIAKDSYHDERKRISGCFLDLRSLQNTLGVPESPTESTGFCWACKCLDGGKVCLIVITRKTQTKSKTHRPIQRCRDYRLSCCRACLDAAGRLKANERARYDPKKTLTQSIVHTSVACWVGGAVSLSTRTVQCANTTADDCG